MKSLLQWMHDHPLKAALFSMFFTFIAAFAGCRTDLLWLCVAAYSSGLGILAICMWLDDLERISLEEYERAHEENDQN